MESEMLNNAANEGSVETLLKLLRKDKLVLQRYVAECPKETPLHIAVMKGHLGFTKAVLDNMPEMANELNSRKSSPLHVATALGRILIVKELLSVNPEMCFAKDCEGRNPLHMAVIKGHIDILKELLKFKPQAAQALLGASTILHLCVKHHQLEALKCILEVFPDDAAFVNSKDEEGSSILHLAVAGKQTEVVKFLLQEHGKVDVNARNAYEFTAWDISLALGRRDIKDIEVAECLQQARELGATSTTRSRFRSEGTTRNDSSANVSEPKFCGTGLVTEFKNLCFKTAQEDQRRKTKRLQESCNALMIAASIITTVTFQALIQPPAEFKSFHPPDKFNNTQPPDQNLNTGFLSCKYDLYMAFNTLSFSATICVLLILISGLPLKHRDYHVDCSLIGSNCGAHCCGGSLLGKCVCTLIFCCYCGLGDDDLNYHYDGWTCDSNNHQDRKMSSKLEEGQNTQSKFECTGQKSCLEYFDCPFSTFTKYRSNY